MFKPGGESDSRCVQTGEHKSPSVKRTGIVAATEVWVVAINTTEEDSKGNSGSKSFRDKRSGNEQA